MTGFLFHPACRDLLYIRTDIGGSYRYDYREDTWHCLTEWAGRSELWETYPIALAVDEKHPDWLFIACGENGGGEGGRGVLSISRDRGKTYIHKALPCYAHGNRNGRGTGCRLAADGAVEGGLYFASQQDGLWHTEDFGDTWHSLTTGGETYMTLVWCSPDGGTVVAGTAGVVTGTPSMRGHSLYVSYDRGKSFAPLAMPENVMVKGSKWSGYTAHRIDYDGRFLYVTLNNTGERSYVTKMGYSCDSGDVLGGRIIRYAFDDAHKISGFQDVTPVCLYGGQGAAAVSRDSVYPFGFGGISSCRAKPGLLAASTVCKDDGDMLFLSFDYGEHWEPALYDLEVGNLHFHTSYMKPEYNGGHSLIHWISDVKINPFDGDEVWFNSGTGVFRSRNFTARDRSFSDCCRGIEETVHLNVYSPPEGPVKVLDLVGDLGGFAFTELDKPCRNSFSDREGNRYITCINADFPDDCPGIVAVTPRGNWKGKTKGGLILSGDYGLTFDRIPLPFGISPYLDERFREIEKPNVNSGWVALSADAKTLVYCVAEGTELFMKGIIVSHDQGKTFQKVRIFDGEGADISGTALPMKVFSDRVNPRLFYGFSDDFQMYASGDGGDTFYPVKVEEGLSGGALFKGDKAQERPAKGLPAREHLEKECMAQEHPAKGRFPVGEKMSFGLIDCADRTKIRGEAGKEGVFYMAAGSCGLWKLFFDTEHRERIPLGKGRVRARRLTREGEAVFCVGLGLLHQDRDYRKDDKALYICGIIQGVYGFFRSFDDGKTWEKLNGESQQFGDINSIEGDSRKVGRFYIATGSFGLKYGEPAAE